MFSTQTLDQMTAETPVTITIATIDTTNIKVKSMDIMFIESVLFSSFRHKRLLNNGRFSSSTEFFIFVYFVITTTEWYSVFS